MQKELNPELFGTGVLGQTRYKETEKVSPHRSAQQTDEKIAEVKTSIHKLAEQMASMAGQVNEYIKVSQSKLERVHGTIKQNEFAHESFRQETNQRMSNVHQRLNEKKSSDAKVQDLMDRQNSILKSFEVRLNHMQRLLAEKDAQVVSALASLNEAKMEIARLKRL